MARNIVGMDGKGIKAAFGKNIKFLRSKKRYSQADLAERADISITFLSNIERGLKFPKPEKISQIAQSLGVEVYELFKTNSEPNIGLIDEANYNKKMLNRLSKVMTRKVNDAMEGVFQNFMK